MAKILHLCGSEDETMVHELDFGKHIEVALYLVKISVLNCFVWLQRDIHSNLIG
jgi:hypothetical protein